MSAIDVNPAAEAIDLPRMLKVLKALTLEYWFAVWFAAVATAVLTFLSCSSVFYALYYYYDGLRTELEITTEANIGTFVLAFSVGVLLSLWGAINASSQRGKGFPKHLFLLPINTTSIVVTRWLTACIIGTAVFVIPMMVANSVYGFWLPITIPSIVLFTLIGAGVGISWTIQDRNLWRLGMWLPLCAMIVTFGLRAIYLNFLDLDGSLVDPRRDQAIFFWSSTVASTFIVICCCVGSFFITLQGVTVDRSGGFRTWLPEDRIRSQVVLESHKVRTSRFLLPTIAQTWYEFRSRVWIAPLICLVVQSFIAISWLAFSFFTGSNPEINLAFLYLVPIFFPVSIGYFFGAFRDNQAAGLWTFLASHPRTDSQLAWPMIWSSIFSLLLCYVVALIVAIFALFVAGLLPTEMAVGQISAIFMSLLLVFAAHWIIIGFTMSILLTGRRSVLLVCTLVVFSIVILIIWFGLLGWWNIDWIRKLVISMVAIFLFGATIGMFVPAAGKAHFTWPTIVGATAAYVVIALSIFASRVQDWETATTWPLWQLQILACLAFLMIIAAITASVMKVKIILPVLVCLGVGIFLVGIGFYLRINGRTDFELAVLWEVSVMQLYTALVFTPFATIPLALHWNRHR